MTPFAANDEINNLIQVPTGAKGWMKLNLNQTDISGQLFSCLTEAFRSSFSLCWMEVSRNLGYFFVTKRFTLNFSAIFAHFLSTFGLTFQ
ncbi:hypothetical protein Plhal710r2_c033g0122091 [Plasmopara halstedii]